MLHFWQVEFFFQSGTDICACFSRIRLYFMREHPSMLKKMRNRHGKVRQCQYRTFIVQIVGIENGLIYLNILNADSVPLSSFLDVVQIF